MTEFRLIQNVFTFTTRPTSFPEKVLLKLLFLMLIQLFVAQNFCGVNGRFMFECFCDEVFADFETPKLILLGLFVKTVFLNEK